MAEQNTDDAAKHFKKPDTSFPKSLFMKKYTDDEKYPAIFRTRKLWIALLGELFGTMLLTLVLMCTLGVFRADWVPIMLFCAILAIYVIFAKTSGANLNPLVTAGMMVTRRMPVIRGFLYIVAQFLGAGLAALILSTFKSASGTTELAVPTELIQIDNTSFAAIALIELVGAIILSFCFIRALKNAKRNTLLFAFCVTSSIIFIHLFGLLLSQNYYAMYYSLVFNPASATFYDIFANVTGGVGQVALTILAYIGIPILGGIVGALIADSASILSEEKGSKLCQETED